MDELTKNNGYYRAVWGKRKTLTKTSYIAGAIVSAILTVILAIVTAQEYGFHPDAIPVWLIIFALMALMIGSIIMVIRAIKQGSQGAAAMGAIIGLVSGTIGLMAGAFSFAFRAPGILTIFFLFLDLFVCAVCGIFLLALFVIYAVYIPISDIYYCVKAHQEAA